MKCFVVLSLGIISVAYSRLVSQEENGCEDNYFKCANDECVLVPWKVCRGLPQCHDQSDLKVCGNPDGYDMIRNLSYTCDEPRYTQCPSVNKNSRLTTFECWNKRDDSCKYYRCIVG